MYIYPQVRPSSSDHFRSARSILGIGTQKLQRLQQLFLSDSVVVTAVSPLRVSSSYSYFGKIPHATMVPGKWLVSDQCFYGRPLRRFIMFNFADGRSVVKASSLSRWGQRFSFSTKAVKNSGARGRPSATSAPHDSKEDSGHQSYLRLYDRNKSVAEFVPSFKMMAEEINNSTQLWNAQDVCKLLRKLKGLDVAALPLLAAIAGKCRQSTSVFASKDISQALYCLSDFSDKHHEVRLLLHALLEKCDHSNCLLEMDSKQLSAALYGIGNMSSEHEIVRKWLSKLSSSLANNQSLSNVDDFFGPAELCNAVLRLKHMSCDNEEVRDCVRILYQRLLGCTEPFRIYSITKVCLAVQNMRSAEGRYSHEIDSVVQYLMLKLTETMDAESMTGKQINAVLNCFVAGSSIPVVIGTPATERILVGVADQLRNRNVLTDVEDICSALNALGNGSSWYDSTPEILSAITASLSECGSDLNENNCLQALTGLLRLLAAARNTSVSDTTDTHEFLGQLCSLMLPLIVDSQSSLGISQLGDVLREYVGSHAVIGSSREGRYLLTMILIKLKVALLRTTSSSVEVAGLLLSILQEVKIIAGQFEDATTLVSDCISLLASLESRQEESSSVRTSIELGPINVSEGRPNSGSRRI
jgi:hypothetical protein